MPYNHIVTLQQRAGLTATWPEGGTAMHARINKASDKNEYLSAGAVQSQTKLVFSVRFCPAVAAIRGNTQLYRILYNGVPYKIADCDDYMERHREMRLLGVSYT